MENCVKISLICLGVSGVLTSSILTKLSCPGLVLSSGPGTTKRAEIRQFGNTNHESGKGKRKGTSDGGKECRLGTM